MKMRLAVLCIVVVLLVGCMLDSAQAQGGGDAGGIGRGGHFHRADAGSARARRSAVRHSNRREAHVDRK